MLRLRLLQILSHVLSFLRRPEDLCSCLVTSKQLQSAMAAARMRMTLTDRPRQLLSFPSHAGALDQLVEALIRYMPGGQHTPCSSCHMPQQLRHRHQDMHVGCKR